MLLFISKAIVDIIRFILGLLPDWDIPVVEVPRSVVELSLIHISEPTRH